MGWRDGFDALVFEKILAVHGDTDTLEFVTENGVIVYGCEGDCCSSSWFEHVSGIDNLIGHTVTNVEEISMNSITPEEEKNYECLQQYGFRISTDKGYFEVDMRNSSNGYYGGYITGPYSRTEPSLKEIKEDF